MLVGLNLKLYISQTVLDEAARGDAEIARRRLEILSDFPLLEVNEAVQDLAAQFIARSNLPPKAADDALHIAVATIYGLEYLLTWNCKTYCKRSNPEKVGSD